MKNWTSSTSSSKPISPVLSPFRGDSELVETVSFQRAWSTQWELLLQTNSSVTDEYGVVEIPGGTTRKNGSWGVLGGISAVVAAKSKMRETAEDLMGRYLSYLQNRNYTSRQEKCSPEICPYLDANGHIKIGIERFSAFIDFSVYRKASELLQERVRTFLVSGSLSGSEVEQLLDKVK
jgi:hypothetical protein